MRKKDYPVQKDVQKAHQKGVSRGLHTPGRAVELGGPTTSMA